MDTIVVEGILCPLLGQVLVCNLRKMRWLRRDHDLGELSAMRTELAENHLVTCFSGVIS